MEFTEKVNFEIATKLANITYSQFLTLYKCASPELRDEDIELDSAVMAQYKVLVKYCQTIVASNNNHVVKYGFVENKTCGRLQSKTASLQRIYNGYRGLLSDGVTYDLDMNNCHIKILIDICKKHNVECHEIQRYDKNREEYLSELMTAHNLTRAAAKARYLACINKEDLTVYIDKKPVKSKKFKAFDEQTTAIMRELYDIYSKKKDVFDCVSGWNYKGKFLNALLTKHENELLNRAISYMRSKHIEISTLMFDGIMIYIDDSKYDIDGLIEEVDFLFREEQITWSVKPHNIDLLDTLKEMKVEDVDVFICDNVIELTEHILGGILKDKIYRSGSEMYLITQYGIISDMAVIKSSLRSLVSKQDYHYTINHMADEKKVEEVKASKVSKYINEITSELMDNAPENPNIIADIWNETQFKIVFNNGYYDFKLAKFIYGKYDRTFIKIDMDYVEEVNTDARNTLYKKVLFPIFGIDGKHDKEQRELLQYYLHTLSHMLAGDIERKKWIISQGLRNCGKGVISDLLKNAFGSYVKTTNSGNFILKKTQGDQAKNLSWIVDYEFKRLAITQEISLGQNEYVDGNAIKKFCSGGDYIEARQNYKNEKELRIQCGLMVCCNDMPKVEPTDCMDSEFLQEFQMKSKFIDDDFDESKKLNGFKYYPKDNELKSTVLNNPDIIMAFIQCIFDAYDKDISYPTSIRKELEANDNDDDYTVLFELFEFTEDVKDKITNKDLESYLKRNRVTFNPKKVKQLLKTKGCKDYQDSVGKFKGRGLNGLKKVTAQEEYQGDEKDL